MEVVEADELIEDEVDVPLQEQEVEEEIGGKM
jgi:hypothetical protein